MALGLHTTYCHSTCLPSCDHCATYLTSSSCPSERESMDHTAKFCGSRDEGLQKSHQFPCN